MSKKILRWLPALLITSCSFYLSSQEHVAGMPSFAMADKLVHFVCFGVLAFAVSFAIDIKRYVMVYAPVLIVSAYGVIDEIHQSMVPGRECSVGDWVADTIGAVAGVAMYVVVSEWMVEWKERRSEGGSASGRLSRA